MDVRPKGWFTCARDAAAGANRPGAKPQCEAGPLPGFPQNSRVQVRPGVCQGRTDANRQGLLILFHHHQSAGLGEPTRVGAHDVNAGRERAGIPLQRMPPGRQHVVDDRRHAATEHVEDL